MPAGSDPGSDWADVYEEGVHGRPGRVLESGDPGQSIVVGIV